MALRIFKTEAQDLLSTPEAVEAAIRSNAKPEDFEVPEGIDEKRITGFCTGCDHFSGAEKPCTLVGANDQARYAFREWCGWASVKGVRGKMTATGFKS